MKIKYASLNVMDLKPGDAGSLELTDGTTLKYGVIRLERDALVHYTWQGLQTVHKRNMNEEEKAEANRLKAILKEPNGEQQLMALGHIARTPFTRMARLLS